MADCGLPIAERQQSATAICNPIHMTKGRIEAFSDGVFAIIITLLVLEIHVPQLQGKDVSAALAQSLLTMAPKFLLYILSFVRGHWQRSTFALPAKH